MTLAQFQEAYAIAIDLEVSLINEDFNVMIGCALPDFKQVCAPKKAVARFIRYQCINLNGSTDSVELDSLRTLFCTRRRVVMV